MVKADQGMPSRTGSTGWSGMARPLLLILLALAMVIAGTVASEDSFTIDRKLLKQMEEECGSEAAERLLAWERIIVRYRGLPEMEKLSRVNSFFNSSVRYTDDWDVWGVEDYWATPYEFLCKNAGDCEDFAIAKFFTLLAMGVEEDKLNIMYVKALQYRIAHMVLAYYSEPDAEPLILDNLVDDILPASQRPDLLPVFGFNVSGLWTARQRAQGDFEGSRSARIRPWKELMEKMPDH